MTTPIPDTISREEFDKRLDESNERQRTELQQRAEEQAQIEQLLTRYEHTLDEIEVELSTNDDSLSYPVLIRKRLEEPARKTIEVATTL